MSDNNNDILHVEGGKPLNGTIKVRGAKNFVSKAMVRFAWVLHMRRAMVGLLFRAFVAFGEKNEPGFCAVL